MRLVLACALALGLTAPEARATSFSWNARGESAAAKRERTYRLWMRKGERLAQRTRSTIRHFGGQYRFRAQIHWALEAVIAFEAASATDRTKAEPHLRAAELLSRFVVNANYPPRRALVRTAHHYAEFERKAPADPRIEQILSRRAIVYTKLADPRSLRLAVADYEHAIRSAHFTTESAGEQATTLSNLAEVHMMLGDLDESIVHYQLALRRDRSILAAFGLAVALDRDGQQVRAREVLARYVSTEQGLAKLVEPHVFFVPAGEVHYYKALGHEVIGNLKDAIASWERFLRSGASPRYQPRARANLEHLRHLLRKGKNLPVYRRRFSDIHP